MTPTNQRTDSSLTWPKSQLYLQHSISLCHKLNISCDICFSHCVKSVRIASYFWSVFSCFRTRNNSVFGHFSRNVINSENCVKLLGVEIGNKLSFEKTYFYISQKTSNQQNAISTMQNFMDFKQKEILLNSYVYSSFSYCPLV